MIQYTIGLATYSDIRTHLEACKNNFVPPLQNTVDIDCYAEKIKAKSITFEAWQNGHLAGLIAAYFNDPGKEFGFITNVSVESGFAGKGIASTLLNNAVKYAQENGFSEIKLKVHARNALAIRLYTRHAFTQSGTEEDYLLYRLMVNQQN